MAEQKPPSDLRPARVIRVFVSSTFRDMQAERDVLVLRVFPQLRRMCEARGVTWGEVDLRWGITEDQAERGDVLPICLEEIRRCRPYFIGLLGERYGWILDSLPAEVVTRQPWIQEQAAAGATKSITELEILHGVLNDPAMAAHAFFYFRDPKFLDSVPPDRRADFATECSESWIKLQHLKDRIRQEHQTGRLKYEPREDYANAEALAALVLADFTELIDTLYPEGEQPSSLERERTAHETFARSRAGIYIGRQEYFDQLDIHVAGNGPPLVVLGESGSGKSALLSKWALGYREQHPRDFLLVHFIGSSPDSASATRLVRRIMLELKEWFDLPDEVPSRPEGVLQLFPDWLAQAAGRARIVLVLDALDQLEPLDNAPDLGWLPAMFPPSCRVILSTLPGRSLNAVTVRGWTGNTSTLEVQPLDESERRRLIHDFLQQFSRDLGTARTERLVDARQTSNPLYLRILLNELRVFGVHEKLNERTDWYLEAKDPYELYRKVITRWEQDYGDGSTLVCDTLSLLWAARRGLSESELLDALGEPGRPLPRAVWSPLFLAMSDALTNRSGLLTYFHAYLRQAVHASYLSRPGDGIRVHITLARYFEAQDDWTDRKADELPWQWAEAEEWSELHRCLSDRAFFSRALSTDGYQLLAYWLRLEPRHLLHETYPRILPDWTASLAQQTDVAAMTFSVGSFLHTAGRYAAAEQLLRRAIAIEEEVLGPENERTARSLLRLGMIVDDKGDSKAAEDLLRRALAMFTRILGPEHITTALTLHELGLVLHGRENHAAAEEVLRRALAIRERAGKGEEGDAAATLHVLGMVLSAMGNTAQAEHLLRRALAIYERTLGPAHPNAAGALNVLASILQKNGDDVGREALLRRSLAIYEQVLGPGHKYTGTALSALAELVQSKGNYEGAEELLRRAVVAKDRGFGREHGSTATSLHTLGLVLRRRGDNAGAEEALRRALAIHEETLGSDHTSTATTLHELGWTLQESGDLPGAETLLRRALAIYEQTSGSEHSSTATTLHTLGLVLRAKGDHAGAEEVLRRALAIHERAFGSDHNTTAATLHVLGVVLRAKGDHAGAEEALRRALAIHERAFGSEHSTTATTLYELGWTLQESGDLPGAETILRRALAIYEQTSGSEHSSTATTLHTLGLVLRAKGDHAGAEEVLRRALAIHEQFDGGEYPLVARDLDNLAGVLADTGGHAEAERLYRGTLAARERRLGAERPDTLMIMDHLADVVERRGDYAAAERLRRRVLDATERAGRTASPEFALNLNGYALVLRRLERFGEAAQRLRQAIVIEDRLLPPAHPKRPHRRNHLAIVLLMAGQLPDATETNEEAWELKSHVSDGGHDMTSARILFTRIALHWLRGTDQTTCLGQLRTLLGQTELPCYGGIAPQWQAQDILQHLRARLSTDQCDLLTAIVAAMNDREELPQLDRSPIWRNQPLIALDALWPRA